MKDNNIKRQLLFGTKKELINERSYKILFDHLTLNDKILRSTKGDYEIIAYSISNEHYRKSLKYIEELSDRYLAFYSKKLSKELDIPFEFSQWNLLVIPWLENFLVGVFFYYERLKRLNSGNTYALGGYRAETAYDLYGFFEQFYYSLEYRALICLYICEQIGIEVKESTEQKLHYDLWFKNTEISFNGLKMNNIENADVLVVQSRLSEEYEQMIEKRCAPSVVFKKYNFFSGRSYDIIKEATVDKDKRKRVFNCFKGNNEFENLIDGLVCEFLPMSLFESLNALYKRALIITEGWNFRKIYHSSITYPELFMLCCAIKKDIVLCDIQHAPGYLRYEYYGDAEYRTCDRFLTWGWQADRYKGIVRPVAEARYAKKSDELIATENNNKILVVSATPQVCVACGIDCSDYNKNRLDFIENIPKEIRKKIVFRCRQTGPFGDESFISLCKYMYPEVRFENSEQKPMKESMKEAELVIIDYWSGTINEAISEGVPFVVTEDYGFFSDTGSKNKSFFETMKKCEMYYSSGKDLAKILSKYKNNKMGYYDSEKRKIFFEAYKTISNDKIIDSWSKEFAGE